MNERSHDRENTTTSGASKDVKGKSSLTPLELINSQWSAGMVDVFLSSPTLEQHQPVIRKGLGGETCLLESPF